MRSNFRKPAVRHWPTPCGAVTFFSLIGARDCVDGMWRSPVAHLNGVQGVAGSNPVIPMCKRKPGNDLRRAGLFVFEFFLICGTVGNYRGQSRCSRGASQGRDLMGSASVRS